MWKPIGALLVLVGFYLAFGTIAFGLGGNSAMQQGPRMVGRPVFSSPKSESEIIRQKVFYVILGSVIIAVGVLAFRYGHYNDD